MTTSYSMPRWYAGAQVADQQHTPSGEVWTVMSVEAGGRVIHWEALDGRVGRCEVTPDHPEYPTDEQVIESARAAKRAARAKPVVWPWEGLRLPFASGPPSSPAARKRWPARFQTTPTRSARPCMRL